MANDKNIIKEFLNDIVGDHTQFHPSASFYDKTGIGNKRWGQIYRGDKSPTLDEIDEIAKYFRKGIKVITDLRQLNILDVEGVK